MNTTQILFRSGAMLLGLTAFATGCMPSCELRKPFEASVVAAGVDGSKVRSGIFAELQPYQETADGMPQGSRLKVLAGALGRVVFENDTTDGPMQMSVKPIQAASANLGYVSFSLLDPVPETETELVVVTWYDANDNGALDLSLDQDSEVARTIYRFLPEDSRKVYLWAYQFNPSSDDPYYTATALSEPAYNYIVTADQLSGWMAVITGETEAPYSEEEN